MKCPFCAEEIKEEAKKCRYCGEWISDFPTGSRNNKSNFLSVSKKWLSSFKERWAEKHTIYISQEDPYIVKDLKLYPATFEYEGKFFKYESIEHLGWDWSSTTYNGIIKTQSAELSIYLNDHKSPIEMKEKTAYSNPKLVLAYDYLVQKTYSKRFSYYSNQLLDHGYFEYNGARIHIDKIVEYKDRRYMLVRKKRSIVLKKLDGGFSFGPFIDKFIDYDVYNIIINKILDYNEKESSQS
jgi:hypothetical protein